MKVILLKQVKGVGKAGDVKEVTPGYAHNYLVPNGLGRIMTAATASLQEQLHKAQQNKVQKQRKKFEQLARKVNGLRFEMKVKADDTNTLFASVQAKHISAELVKRGYDVQPNAIQLAEPIKKLGFYEIPVDLQVGVPAQIKITITKP